MASPVDVGCAHNTTEPRKLSLDFSLCVLIAVFDHFLISLIPLTLVRVPCSELTSIKVDLVDICNLLILDLNLWECFDSSVS